MSFQGPISSSVSPACQRLVQQVAFMRDAAAPQADHGQSEPAAKLGFDDRLADQLRGRQAAMHLRHADLLRPVGEVGSAERQRFQRKLLPERLDVAVRREQIDQQDIADLQLRLRGRAQDLRGKLAVALDGHDACAGRAHAG